MAQGEAVRPYFRRGDNGAPASPDTDSHDDRRGGRSDWVDHRLVHLRFEPSGIFRRSVQADHDRDRYRGLTRKVSGWAAYAALRRRIRYPLLRRAQRGLPPDPVREA